MDIPSLGFQEYAVIFGLFFLLGLLQGRSWMDQSRASRIGPSLRVSAIVSAFPLAVSVFMGIQHLRIGGGIGDLMAMMLGGLAGVAGLFLIFCLPFTAGTMLWRQRHSPGISL